MVKLSFIIPFFNGKKYIRECLNSLYSQDVPESEYEVIVVDDCSADKDSINLLYQFRERHSNMKIIHNVKNLRCGGSRNVGIGIAKGVYVWFVDQDDLIESNVLNFLLNICFSESLDYLTFDFSDYYSIERVEKHNLVTINSSVVSGLSYIKRVCLDNIWNNNWDTNVWHQIYKRSFLKAHNILFSEFSYCDDMVFALRALVYAQRILSLNSSFYLYRYNETSVLHTEVGNNGRPIFDASMNVGVELLNFSNEINAICKEFSKHIYEASTWRINSFTKRILRITSPERQRFYNLVESNDVILQSCTPYLNSTNKWLLSHKKIVNAIPLLIWAFIKCRQYIYSIVHVFKKTF